LTTRPTFLAIRKNRVTAENLEQKIGAVLYLRVSTKDQVENFSIETQQKACVEYCQRQGYTVLEVFQDAKSAKTANRPQFQAMLKYCRKHNRNVAAVVVYQVSRFARDTADHMTVRKSLQELRIRLFSVTEQFDDSPSGRFHEVIASGQAQYDNDQRAKRTIDGMTTAIRAGKWCHKAPVGYLNASCPGGLLPDPQSAPQVRRAFELFASGEHTKVAVLERVTGLGLKTRAGKSLSAQTFDKLLRSPIYAGWIISRWGFTVRGKFEPIITEELFQCVESRLMGNGSVVRQVRSIHSEDFPLRVFVRCAACGKGITGSMARGRHGKRYGHYFCRTPGCRAVKFRQDDLHRMFYELLYDLIPQVGMMPLFNKVLQDVWSKKNAEREERLAAVQKERQKLEARRQRIMDLLIDAAITKQVCDEQMERVGTALRDLEMQTPEATANAHELENLLEFADWMLNRVAGIWNSAALPNKLRLQEAFFPEGLAVSNEGFGTASTPLFFGQYEPIPIAEVKMASPRGFEPLLSP
jgi:site-specific DNA recombinase